MAQPSEYPAAASGALSEPGSGDTISTLNFDDVVQMPPPESGTPAQPTIPSAAEETVCPNSGVEVNGDEDTQAPQQDEMNNLNEREKVVNTLMHRGFSVMQLLKFYSEEVVDAAATTEEVVRRVVLPPTSADGCYMQSEFMENLGGGKKASTLASHAWKNHFSTTVENIVMDACRDPRLIEKWRDDCGRFSARSALHLLDELDEEAAQKTYWLCVLAVSQHQHICGDCLECKPRCAADLSMHNCPECGNAKRNPCECGTPKLTAENSGYQIDKFRDVVQRMDHGVFVSLDPALNTLKRAWVLGEISEAILGKKLLRFHAAGGLGRKLARRLLNHNGCLVPEENDWECTSEDDKKMIVDHTTRSDPKFQPFMSCMMELQFGQCSSLEKVSDHGRLPCLTHLRMNFAVFGSELIDLKKLRLERLPQLRGLRVLSLDLHNCSGIESLREIQDNVTKLKALEELLVNLGGVRETLAKEADDAFYSFMRMENLRAIWFRHQKWDDSTIPHHQDRRYHVRLRGKALVFLRREVDRQGQVLNSYSVSKLILKFGQMHLDSSDFDDFKANLKNNLKSHGAEQWALDNVSIDVMQGSVIAAIRGPETAIQHLRALRLDEVQVDGYIAAPLRTQEDLPTQPWILWDIVPSIETKSGASSSFLWFDGVEEAAQPTARNVASGEENETPAWPTTLRSRKGDESSIMEFLCTGYDVHAGRRTTPQLDLQTVSSAPAEPAAPVVQQPPAGSGTPAQPPTPPFAADQSKSEVVAPPTESGTPARAPTPPAATHKSESESTAAEPEDTRAVVAASSSTAPAAAGAALVDPAVAHDEPPEKKPKVSRSPEEINSAVPHVLTNIDKEWGNMLLLKPAIRIINNTTKTHKLVVGKELDLDIGMSMLAPNTSECFRRYNSTRVSVGNLGKFDCMPGATYMIDDDKGFVKLR